MSGEARDMLSDELVEAMESLHLYPRLIAERAAKEARRAALTALRTEAKWDNPMMTHPAALKAVAEYRAMILAAIDRALGDG